ncbi:Transposon Tn7 transposition transposition regulatory protein tnsE [Pseudoalteromonas sp. JB197]|nr:Transposon Tn7 transposition transposition regulatory protein tnsE [Pseudoalteromonas sp. JB197]
MVGVFSSNILFKNKRVYIGVQWQDGQYSSLPIEMASLAAPGRIFENKKISKETEFERLKVTILEGKGIDKSSDHYRYLYQTDMGVISITGFELARILFFHNRHLVDAAYMANGLSQLAFINKVTSPIKISFPESTTYPVSYLKTKQQRTHLAWLLLDKNARKSLFSIYRSFQKNSSLMAFDFTPPLLKEWQVELSVIKDNKSGKLLVQRIESIVNAHIDREYPKVEISHPKKKDAAALSSKEKAKLTKAPSVDIDPELDLGDIPGFSKRLHSLNSTSFSFNISGIQSATLSDGKKALERSAVINDSGDFTPEKAGVGTPEVEGSAQEFDPIINQEDDFEEAEESPQKFLIFKDVVNELSGKKGIELKAINCGVFPNPTNGSMAIFKTKDKQTLRFFRAIIVVQQVEVVMLEADTTSLIKAKGASTLILGLKDDANIRFKEIIQNFSDNGAQWKHQFIRERAHLFQACNHPRLKHKGKTLNEGEYKEKWVTSLQEKLNQLIKELQGTI